VKKFQVAVMAGVLFLAGCTTEAVAQDVPAARSPGPSILAITPALKPIRIMVCCDSITVGADGVGYRDELSALLMEAGVDPTFIVAAVNSTPCSTWGPLIGGLVKTNRPDVLLLNCGTNDVVSSRAQIEAFENNYRKIIEVARAAGVKIAVSRLQISRVTGNPRLAWLPGNERKINTVIDRVAHIYGDVGYADFSTIEASVDNSEDGVHPSRTGELLYAKAWFSQGQQLGWW
jgi:hypothetical protein